MRKWQKKCKDLCYEKVMIGGFCQKCGGPGRKLDQHHGLFKSSQRYKLNPFFWYDPTLQFCLCVECHLHSPNAPHRDQGRFETAMAVRYADKAKRLREANTGPLPPAIDVRVIDWKLVYEHIVEFGRPLGNEIIAGL